MKNREKYQKETLLYVEVKNNNVEKALSEFKRRVKNSGLLKELREREFYLKPSLVKRNRRKRNKIRNKISLDN
jgi:small subunit ribosomal protein S21|tara:strand:+ start:253 stop:471 length:219 start_codon:yes stop_codon:yes gene_type:complete